MRTTPKTAPRIELLHPAGVLCFAVLALAWLAVAVGPEWQSFPARAVARVAGYVAFAAMLVPYVHIVRRCFRYRRQGAMTTWLRLHIGAAYLAFFMVILHSRGRANGPLTLALVWLTWLVMISGVVGFYGQKLLYYLLPRMVKQEYGLERLGPQRDLVQKTAEDLIKKKEMQQGPEVIHRFCQAALDQCLAKPYRLRGWLRGGEGEELSRNFYERARDFASGPQVEAVDELWQLVEARREMDLEYRLHQLGRLWLFVHGPAAWALLVLMIEHAVMSVWYGGF